MKISSTFHWGAIYKVRVYDSAGNIKAESGDSENLITNWGIQNAMKSSGVPITKCYVGTGTSWPMTFDYRLESFLAATKVHSGNSGIKNTTTPPYYMESDHDYQFPQGSVIGHISEVGMGIEDEDAFFGQYVCSRALIMDISGNPTTITVGASDTLVVNVKFRIYTAPKVTGNVTLFNADAEPIQTMPFSAVGYLMDDGVYPNFNGSKMVMSAIYGSTVPIDPDNPNDRGNQLLMDNTSNYVLSYHDTSCRLTHTFGPTEGNGTWYGFSMQVNAFIPMGGFGIKMCLAQPFTKTAGKTLRITVEARLERFD